MIVARKFSDLPHFQKSTVVAIGNFDGLHLGHKKIISLLVQKAEENDLVSLVLTFATHPGKVTGKGQIQLLQTEKQKLENLADSGVDAVFLVPFDKAFAQLSSRDFFENIILTKLQAREIIVGNNFRFGKDRKGNVQTLVSLAEDNQLTVHSLPAVTIENQVVSSSVIRRLLLAGEINKANRYLGAPYEISGEVIRGKSRGKGLGFPTANLKTSNEILPAGVFITQVEENGQEFPSVTNIGTRPTFGHTSTQIETHVLDVERDFYGNYIRLRFFQKIRDEIRFDSSQALSYQIQADIQTARHYFNI
ncbi:MAG: bifunctional riboflavin kinase/FAD synthetase [Candidatus Aminicenantes bacterium]|nr:bifunctional riboflavin kinase/FAD synthetase [Candidatus Aminicenantes bacterium]